MQKAIYAITWDPITYGHIDVIKRVSDKFDLSIWIWVNADKIWKTTFSPEERVMLIKQALPDFEVKYFTGLLVDYAFEQGISTIIRWIRWPWDLELETNLFNAWVSQWNSVETFFVLAKQNQSCTSSSTVKALLKEQWFINEYVPLNVKQALESRLLWQYIVWITWIIWVWKSYIWEKFVEYWEKIWIPVHNIDLDKIWHDILCNLETDWYKKIREQLVNIFSKEIIWENSFINRKKLGEIVFWHKKEMEKLNKIMYQPILVRLRKEMQNKKWIILLNWALIWEFEMNELCNNNIILIDSDKNELTERLRKRWLTDIQIKNRIESQFGYEQKKGIIEKSIKEKNWWKIYEIKNSHNINEYEKVFEKIISEIDILGDLKNKAD